MGITNAATAKTTRTFDRCQTSWLKLKIQAIGNTSKEITCTQNKMSLLDKRSLLKKMIVLKGAGRIIAQKTIHGCLAHHRNGAVIALGIILVIPTTPTGWKHTS